MKKSIKRITALVMAIASTAVVTTAISSANCTSWNNNGNIIYGIYCDRSSGKCEFYDWRNSEFGYKNESRSCWTGSEYKTEYRTVLVKTGCC